MLLDYRRVAGSVNRRRHDAPAGGAPELAAPPAFLLRADEVIQ